MLWQKDVPNCKFYVSGYFGAVDILGWCVANQELLVSDNTFLKSKKRVVSIADSALYGYLSFAKKR